MLFKFNSSNFMLILIITSINGDDYQKLFYFLLNKNDISNNVCLRFRLFWACMEFPLLSSHDKEKRPVPLSLRGDFFRIFNYYSANWNIFEKQLD